jgi:hypothetical protein
MNINLKEVAMSSLKNLGGCSNTLRGTPNVKMEGAQKIEPRGVYGYTLSGAVCSATQQTMVPFRV